MKLKKFSLKNIDSATSDKISESYPAEWDMDEVFNESYRKFLVSEKNAAENVHSQSFAEDDTLEFCNVENVQKKRSIAILRSNKVIAAACTVFALILLGSLCTLPDRIDESPDDIDRIALATHESSNNPPDDETSESETDVSAQTTLLSTAADKISTASAVSETTPNAKTVTENIEEETQDEETEPEAPEASTEAAPIQTGEIMQTTTPNITETVSVETTAAQTTALPITTEPAATTDRTENPWGYFQRYDYDYSALSKLNYVRNKSEEEAPREHTIGVEIAGIESVSESEWVNVWYIRRSGDEGHFYTLVQYKYSVFSTQIFAESECSYIEIIDRPAVWVNIDSASPALCWDDGCHICHLSGPGGPDSIDFIRSFAENY